MSVYLGRSYGTSGLGNADIGTLFELPVVTVLVTTERHFWKLPATPILPNSRNHRNCASGGIWECPKFAL
jgi:hypothetical protein